MTDPFTNPTIHAIWAIGTSLLAISWLCTAIYEIRNTYQNVGKRPR